MQALHHRQDLEQDCASHSRQGHIFLSPMRIIKRAQHETKAMFTLGVP